MMQGLGGTLLKWIAFPGRSVFEPAKKIIKTKVKFESNIRTLPHVTKGSHILTQYVVNEQQFMGMMVTSCTKFHSLKVKPTMIRDLEPLAERVKLEGAQMLTDSEKCREMTEFSDLIPQTAVRESSMTGLKADGGKAFMTPILVRRRGLIIMMVSLDQGQVKVMGDERIETMADIKHIKSADMPYDGAMLFKVQHLVASKFSSQLVKSTMADEAAENDDMVSNEKQLVHHHQFFDQGEESSHNPDWVVTLAVGSVILSSDSEEEAEGVDENLNVGEEATEEVPAPVTLKRKFPSPVWQFAEKVDGKARCNICKCCFVCPSGNTTNITNHILHKHKNTPEANKLKEDLAEKVKAKKAKEEVKKRREKEGGTQASISSFFTGFKPLTKKVKDEIDDSLVEYLICENESFETVESHFFRKMIFSANKSYVIPSRSTITRKIDAKIIKVKEELKAEINDDISEHKTIAITSDGGSSGDLNKTKKNTLTVSRITEDFCLKTDVISLPEAKGSQGGVVIRSQWKEELVKIGYNSTWIVNATTDGASNFRSARTPGRHADVGLPTKYTTDCLDHQIHLGVEESTKNLLGMKESLRKGKALRNHFSRAPLSRQLLRSIQEELGLPLLCSVTGTSNRWFHKMSAVQRLLEIRDAVEVFQVRSTANTEDDEEPVETLVEADWENMKDYVVAVKGFETISKFFGGQNYPAGTCVIPALDQMKDDLKTLESKFPRECEGKQLARNLVQSMQKRFPNCWKQKNPFNCLTYLNPRYVDMYADTNDLKEQVYDDIRRDSVYDLAQPNDVSPVPSNEAHDQDAVSTTVAPPATSSSAVPSRRAALLAKKHRDLLPVIPNPALTFDNKFKTEFER